MTCICGHSHDGSWNLPHQQPMADRVFISEKAPCNGFVDDRDLRRFGAVLRGERSSAEHVDDHRLKVFKAYEIDIDHRLLPLPKRRTPFDMKQSAGVCSFKRS